MVNNLCLQQSGLKHPLPCKVFDTWLGGRVQIIKSDLFALCRGVFSRCTISIPLRELGVIFDLQEL